MAAAMGAATGSAAILRVVSLEAGFIQPEHEQGQNDRHRTDGRQKFS